MEMPFSSQSGSSSGARSGPGAYSGLPAGNSRSRHACEVHQDRPLVDADADGTDTTGTLQLIERPVGPVEGLLREPVRVVDVQRVEPVDAHPRPAGLQGAHHAVIAEVEVGPHRVGALVELHALPKHHRVLPVGRTVREQQATHLGRQRVLVAGKLPQDLAHDALGEAVAVDGRDIVVADAGAPGRLEGGAGDGLGDLRVEPAQRIGADAELGHGHAGPAQRDPLRRVERCRVSVRCHGRGLPPPGLVPWMPSGNARFHRWRARRAGRRTSRPRSRC